MKHFELKSLKNTSLSYTLKEGILPLAGLLGITAVLVATFYLCLHLGRNMEPVIPIHVDDGETVDPNPLRLVFMITAFILSFVLNAIADRKGKHGKVFSAFWIGYTAGTLLWQSVGECAWHFSIMADDYLMCFPHIEGASALFLVIITCILLVYCYLHKTFSWGLWVFVLSFVGNWFGHFVMIGTYPMVHMLIDEEVWFRAAGAIIGSLVCIGSLLLNLFAARDTKARLCCCLMLYFGIGIIVTGVTGI